MLKAYLFCLWLSWFYGTNENHELTLLVIIYKKSVFYAWIFSIFFLTKTEDSSIIVNNNVSRWADLKHSLMHYFWHFLVFMVKYHGEESCVFIGSLFRTKSRVGFADVIILDVISKFLLIILSCLIGKHKHLSPFDASCCFIFKSFIDFYCLITSHVSTQTFYLWVFFFMSLLYGIYRLLYKSIFHFRKIKRIHLYLI
jgi:hypothetical protein